MKLQNKVAVITGGSSGIGFGIAKKFVDEGASIAISGRDPRKLNTACGELGDNVLAIDGDVSDLGFLDRFYRQVHDELGNIDIIVANAGIVNLLSVQEVTEEHFDMQVNINFKGTYFTVQKALPYLNDGASIILVSSNGHRMGLPNTTVYAATKAAIRSLARTFSADLLDRRIRANVISPGGIKTPIFSKFGLPDELVPVIEKIVEDSIPIKRFGTPEEVGTVAVFLACGDSSFVIGEDIAVDAGWTNLDVTTQVP